MTRNLRRGNVPPHQAPNLYIGAILDRLAACDETTVTRLRRELGMRQAQLAPLLRILVAAGLVVITRQPAGEETISLSPMGRTVALANLHGSDNHGESE